MLTEITKMFTEQELRKLKGSYSNKSILEIIENFRINCEIVKNNVLDTKWEMESKFYIIKFRILGFFNYLSYNIKLLIEF